MNRQEVEQFRAMVVSHLGFCVDDHNVDQVGEVLRHRLGRANCETAASYFRRLQNASFLQAELREVAAELSVGETYFFRHPEHFMALVESAIPGRLLARKDTRQLRILSAGCASGEEVYSLAASVRRVVAACADWDVRLWGIDINHRLLKAAAQGRYNQWSLRGVAEADRRVHFSQDGRHYILDPNIRSMVTFEERNLLSEDPAFWRPGYFDIIFCRNVMIYFSPPALRQAVECMTRSLAPGGFLFLGPSETLRGVTHEFHLRHTHGAFYYQRRCSGETAQRPACVLDTVDIPPKVAEIAVKFVEQDEASWIAAISQATTRIAALANQSKCQAHSIDSAANTGIPRPPQPSVADVRPLDAIRELLRQERFDDALQRLQALPAGSQADADTLLLLAVLLVNKAEVTKAQGICRQLLALDELNAGAHYLMAVCQEHAGDTLAAAEHDQSAIYLDPGFAMPHLHLGLLARRLGDVTTAKRELGEALVLLPREDASRILLFGGGFHRDALTQYCQSQLRCCGGAS